MPILPYGSPAQSNQQMSLFAVSNTTQGTSMTVNASNHSFAGAGAASVGMSNGSVVISVPPAGAGGGIALANSQTTYSSGTVNLVEGGGAITIASNTNQSYQVSVPATSSLSGTGGIQISTNGSTISIGAPANTTLSRWAEPDDNFTSIGATAQGSLSIQRVWIPFYVSASAALIAASISASTGTTSTTSGSVNNSLWMGVYSLSGSNLSLASSGSANNAFTWGLSGSTSKNTSVNSMRVLTVPINLSITPGEYWIGAVLSQATTQTAVGMTAYGGSLIANAANNAAMATIGSNVTGGRPPYHMQGIYTAATSVGPSSIGTSDLNFTSASNVQRANIYVQIYNATY